MVDNQDGGEARPPRWFGEAIGVHRELAALGVKVGALHENKLGKDSIADINKNIQSSGDATFIRAAQLLENSLDNRDRHLEARMEGMASKAANQAADRVAQDFTQNSGSRRGWHPLVHQVGGGSIASAILAILYMFGAIPGG